MLDETEVNEIEEEMPADGWAEVITDSSSRHRASDWLARLTEQFQASGGTINEIPPGLRTNELGICTTYDKDAKRVAERANTRRMEEFAAREPMHLERIKAAIAKGLVGYAAIREDAKIGFAVLKRLEAKYQLQIPVADPERLARQRARATV